MHSSSRTNVPRQARRRGQNREAKRTRVSTVKFYYVFGKKNLAENFKNCHFSLKFFKKERKPEYFNIKKRFIFSNFFILSFLTKFCSGRVSQKSLA